MSDKLKLRKLIERGPDRVAESKREKRGWIERNIVERFGEEGYPNAGAALGTAADMAVEYLHPESEGEATLPGAPSWRAVGGAAGKAAEVVEEVAEAVGKPVGKKLSEKLIDQIPEKEFEKAIDVLRVEGQYPVKVGKDAEGVEVIKYLRKEDPEVQKEILKLRKKRGQ
jgi:hypothetical protein